MIESAPRHIHVRMLQTVAFISTLVGLSGCKRYFNHEELMAYAAYEPGDTIILRSSLGEQDTLIIESKFIFHTGGDGAMSFFNLPSAVVTYRNGRFPYWTMRNPFSRKEEKQLLVSRMHLSDDRLSEDLYFEGFIGTIDRATQQTTALDSLYSSPIYKVPRFDLSTARDSVDVTYVFWSDSLGVVAYDTKADVRWSLVHRSHLPAQEE